MRLSRAQPGHQARKGIVLLAVLMVVVLLALAAYQYSDLTLAEYKTADFNHRQIQARAIADSGIHYTMALLSNPDNIANVLGGNPYHNPTAFANIAVPTDDKKGFPGKFTLLAPTDPEDSSVNLRHGVTDEASKINLNALMQLDPTGQVLHDILMKLPNMTDEIASSVVDWLDADSQPRTGGAENDFYSGLNSAYRAKNGPLESLEELLLVKGVTAEFLFGKDHNHNGLLDSGEDNESSTLDRGWSAFLTIYSREQNLDATGQPLLNLNDSDLATLFPQLSTAVGEDLAKYIILYRQNGPASASGGSQSFASSIKSLFGGSKDKKSSGKSSSSPTPIQGNLSNLSSDSLNLTRRGKQKIKSIFELIETQVSVPGKDSKSPNVIYTSPLKDPGNARTMLPSLFDKTTLDAKTEIPARININTAPREVLAALPNMTDADVQSILGTRPRLTASETPSEIFRTPAWLYTEASIKPATLQKMEKYLTTRAQVFRLQVVGTLDSPGPPARLEAIIDTNAGKPRILAWRDLTELGKGWNP